MAESVLGAGVEGACMAEFGAEGASVLGVGVVGDGVVGATVVEAGVEAAGVAVVCEEGTSL